MKTFLIIVVTAGVTWTTMTFIHGTRTNVQMRWLISAIKAPGRMAISDIQKDMNAGSYDVAKAKIDVLMTTWQRFDAGSDSFTGAGIGDIMTSFSRLETGSSSALHAPCSVFRGRDLI